MIFALFNEIGIIEQLSRAMFEARLPKGVLVSHFAVLNHLIRVKDGRTPLELANAFQLPKTTLSHTLALLEKRGWIEMRPNPGDKRSKQVWITGDGRTFRDEAIGRLSSPATRSLRTSRASLRVLPKFASISTKRAILADRIRPDARRPRGPSRSSAPRPQACPPRSR
jgi:DNA-binding MarR family transcriptional regulator